MSRNNCIYSLFIVCFILTSTLNAFTTAYYEGEAFASQSGGNVISNVVRPKAIECHVWAPGVIPILEFFTQRNQMIKTLDEHYSFEPFIL
jgi:hypothetical protein